MKAPLHYTIVISIFLSLFSISTRAQAGHVDGKITDDKNIALGYAVVNLLSGKDSLTFIMGALADEQGSYSFTNIPAGNYIISAVTAGGQVFSAPFSLADAGIHMPDIVLKAKTNALSCVTITASRPLIEQKVDMTVMNVENSTLATGGSLLDILRHAPGVTVDKDGNVTMSGKSGITILLDGRQTYLSGDQLTSLLQSIQGTTVSKIDLITNPSAKYDAAGSAGIIDIHLKKNSSYGTNGTLTLGGGYGQYAKENAGLSLNHRIRHFNFFGNYNFDANTFSRDLRINRRNTAEGVNTYFDQRTLALEKNKDNNYKAGIDYFVDSRNTIGILFNGYNYNNNIQSSGTTIIGSSRASADSVLKTDNPVSKVSSYSALNLNYKFAIDSSGQELTADVDYDMYSVTIDNGYNNSFYNPAGLQTRSPLIFRSSAPVSVNIFAAKADYTYPFDHDTRLDLGVKTSAVSTNNNIHYDNLATGTWQDDATRSNQFIYKEHINAAYASFRKNLKR